MRIVVVSRRFARAVSQQSWVRDDKSPGHLRGLRAGHVSIGGSRELGRASCLLDDIPGMGDRVTKSPGGILGAFPRGPEPGRDTTNHGSTQGIGKRATSEATREGQDGSRSVA